MSDEIILLGRVEAGGLLVVTNNTGKPIPVGTSFTQVIKHRVTVTHPDILSEDLGQVASVDILLEEITLQKGKGPIQVIPVGWSAAIKLVGVGVDTVIHALQNAEKNEKIFLK
ncbi:MULTISPECIES: hypothetical protein [unclassified Dyella]|uniref:hypothetical protein n=1 Tax=unclassified Dyella TaxID=2634549 RepID=UPI000C819EC4|nr:MULTISPECIES: hypothetical protein [unclassified Dyella]MDR3445850.1 hypothetical protein [Dyella sp.]PMQ04365.1 hypothetical protein DyAD56_15295 [Dyella sp. AD56]